MRIYKIACLLIACSCSSISYAKTIYLKCDSVEKNGSNANQFYLSVNEQASNVSVSGSGSGVNVGVYNASFSPDSVQWNAEIDPGIRGLPVMQYSHSVNRNTLEYKATRYFGVVDLWRTGSCSIYEPNGKF